LTAASFLDSTCEIYIGGKVKKSKSFSQQQHNNNTKNNTTTTQQQNNNKTTTTKAKFNKLFNVISRQEQRCQ
jgi:hypothetical protein